MKKALSVLLCMCLLMACVPFGALSAFAEEDSECEHTYRFACEQYCYNRDLGLLRQHLNDWDVTFG